MFVFGGSDVCMSLGVDRQIVTKFIMFLSGAQYIICHAHHKTHHKNMIAWYHHAIVVPQNNM